MVYSRRASGSLQLKCWVGEALLPREAGQECPAYPTMQLCNAPLECFRNHRSVSRGRGSRRAGRPQLGRSLALHTTRDMDPETHQTV